MPFDRSAEEVFDGWAQDYHADGMEADHAPSVAEAIKRIPSSAGNFLEIGVGNGYALQWAARNQFKKGTCLGIDISANMVELAGKRVADLANASVAKADFLSYHPDDTARPDAIFSMEVFYYFPSIEDGIRHAFKILNPGGLLMVLVNHFFERTESHDWANRLRTPMQLWKAQEYEDAFRSAGFVDVQQDLVGVADTASPATNPGTLMTLGVKPH